MSEETSAEATPSSGGASERRPYDPEELIGKTLAGRYEVERCIGKGGMGVVYLAQQRALERMVVIKVLSRSLDDDIEASGRFEREALGMSRLDHPNVVSIYDFGHENDQAYICMEYVDGETLSRRVKRDGAMDVDTFDHIATQLLQGIGEAHSLGLIHRDIKPSNIMLTERHGQQDYVKILDFGLAKLVHNARQVTKEQSLVGSTAFLSPEQIMGNDIDQRVDVYALGVLFYYMLTGVKPFTADDDITVLYQHVHHPAPALADHLPDGRQVPAELVGLIHRMLAKDPEDRPPDAGTIHEELSAIMTATSLQMSWQGDQRGTSGSFPSVGDAGSSSVSGPQGVVQPTAPPSGSHPSGQTFVTDEQMLAMHQANNRRTIAIVMVVLFIFVAGGAGAFWMLRDQHVSAASVQAEIARAEELVDQGKLGRAESVLDLAKSDLRHHPSLKERFAASQDRLAIAKLLADAHFHEEQGKLQGAINNYREILSRNPDHREAELALTRLLDELEQQRAAALLEEESTDEPEDDPSSDESGDDEPSDDQPSDESADNEPVAKSSKPRSTPAKKRTPSRTAKAEKKETKSDKSGGLLLPIEEEEAAAEEEPTNDDVQLLPIE